MATPDPAIPLKDQLTVAARAQRLASAHRLANQYVLAGAGIGLVPVPLFDLVGIMALQVKLVHGLAKHYAVPFEEKIANSLVAALLSGASSVLLANGLFSLFKAIPVLGTLASGSVAISGASVTYAVGAVFIRHFESGGALSDFDPVKMKPQFLTELKNGQAAAEQAAAETPSAVAEPAAEEAPSAVAEAAAEEAPSVAPEPTVEETPSAAEAAAEETPAAAAEAAVEEAPAAVAEAVAEETPAAATPDSRETNPSRPPAPGVADRLEDVIGIGEVYADMLRAAGIVSFAELAALSPERIRQIVGRRALSDESIRSWLKQADDFVQGRHSQQPNHKPKPKKPTQ